MLTKICLQCSLVYVLSSQSFVCVCVCVCVCVRERERKREKERFYDLTITRSSSLRYFDGTWYQSNRHILSHHAGELMGGRGGGGGGCNYT